MLVRLIVFGLFFYLIYFLIKFIFVKPFKEGYMGAQRGSRNSYRPFNNGREEGDVTITYNPEKDHKNPNNKIGEYVDYEEVKE